MISLVAVSVRNIQVSVQCTSTMYKFLMLNSHRRRRRGVNWVGDSRRKSVDDCCEVVIELFAWLARMQREKNHEPRNRNDETSRRAVFKQTRDLLFSMFPLLVVISLGISQSTHFADAINSALQRNALLIIFSSRPCLLFCPANGACRTNIHTAA